jgi:hypothetical protein
MKKVLLLSEHEELTCAMAEEGDLVLRCNHKGLPEVLLGDDAGKKLNQVMLATRVMTLGGRREWLCKCEKFHHFGETCPDCGAFATRRNN